MEKQNKKIIIVVISVVLLATAIFVEIIVIQAAPENKVNRKLKLAQKYLNEMNYEQAVITYIEIITINPKCETAYLAAANIYMKTQREDKAMEILEQARQNIDSEAINAKLEEARKTGTGGGENITQTQKPIIAPANAGEIITFGTYEQDGDVSNRAEPIEWIVLDNQEGRMLVISRYGLDCQPYNTTQADVTWETCTLRNWLNSEFYNMAFNEGEKKVIMTSTLENPDNEHYGTSGGNITKDNIFCLSADEADRYFTKDEERATKPTEYAVNRGVYVTKAEDVGVSSVQGYIGNCCWWLRSPGDVCINAMFVFDGGAIPFWRWGQPAVNNNVSVRPALWIKL